MSYAQMRRRTQKQHTRNSRLPLILALAGALLLLVGLTYGYWTGSGDANTAVSYEADEVATASPVLAVHEMGEGPTIPFLPKNGPQPRISVPETSFNFGTISPTEVVKQTFIVRNEGNAPLTISRAYTTCGCTTAEISSTEIPPGKLATVTIIYDAGFHDTSGQTVRRGLILENNDPRQSQAEIWIQATMRSN